MPFFTIIGHINRIAFFFKAALDELGYFDFIFDDKDTHKFKPF